MQSSIPNPAESLLNSMIKFNVVPFTKVNDILNTGQLDQSRLHKQIYYSLILAIITISRLSIILLRNEKWFKELVFAFRNDSLGNLTQLLTAATIIIITSSIISCKFFLLYIKINFKSVFVIFFC